MIQEDNNTIYLKLIDLLKRNNASFREVSHESEGRSDRVASLRGSSVEQGAKAMVLQAENKFVLAVIPGNLKVDFKKVAEAVNEKKATLASIEDAKELTHCEIGAIPPFVFNNKITLVVDISITKFDEIAFNAARLDRSIFLKTSDYLRIAKPIIKHITK